MSIKRMASGLARAFCASEMWLSLASVGIIVFIMLFTTGEVVGRYLFRSPIPGHSEVVKMLVGALVFLGLAYTERMGGHLKMEAVIEKLPGKPFHLLEFITAVLSLALFVIFTYYGLRYMFEVYEKGYFLSQDAEIPTWPFLIAIPLGAGYLSVRLLVNAVTNLVCLFKRKPAPAGPVSAATKDYL